MLKPRRVSEMMETAGVAAAIESVSGKIYVGVCVDGGCTLGICAERNAIFQMLTYGEEAIRRVVAINWDGKVLAPCGACKDYRKIEVMLDTEKEWVVPLGDLTPNWWI